MSGQHHDPNYLQIIGCSCLIVSPILLVFCFPAQKYIAKLQKELLASSLGTIAGFLFFEIIPDIVIEGQHFVHTHEGHSHVDKLKVLILSNTIFVGIIFAGILGSLHEFLESKESHGHGEPSSGSDNSDATKEKSRKNCLSCMFHFAFAVSLNAKKKILKINRDSGCL